MSQMDVTGRELVQLSYHIDFSTGEGNLVVYIADKGGTVMRM